MRSYLRSIDAASMNTIGDKIQEVAKKLKETIQLFSEVAECPDCNGDPRSKCTVHSSLRDIAPTSVLLTPSKGSQLASDLAKSPTPQ